MSISVDAGKTWKECGQLTGRLDLTDHVKGRQHYLLRFGKGYKEMQGSELVMTTACQANRSILPHLNDGGTKVEYAASRSGIVSAGPELAHAAAHIVEGGFGTKSVTLELATPRREPALEVYAAAHVQSGNPPRPDVKYAIDYSLDGGKSWQPIVRDWMIPRRGEEPADFWSQSLCYGSAKLPERKVDAEQIERVRVRFTNTGGKNYARAEAHLRYRTPGLDAADVTFAWQDDSGIKSVVTDVPSQEAFAWTLPTGKNVRPKWVEIRAKAP